MITLGPQDTGRAVHVPPGETVEVLLPEAYGGGYLWSWQVPEGLRLLSAERASAPGTPGTPGAEARRRLVLTAEQPGRHVLRAALARPWEAAPERQFTVELVSE